MRFMDKDTRIIERKYNLINQDVSVFKKIKLSYGHIDTTDHHDDQ